MNKINLFLLISFLLAASLTGWIYYQSSHRVGDIRFDKDSDNAHFELCDENVRVQPYASYGADYRGGRKAIRKELLQELNLIDEELKSSGLINIRFIVNCKGEVGRFRVKAIDKNIEETTFDHRQTTLLQSSISRLEDWQPGKWKDEHLDSYYQINFRIENGRITDIF